MSALLTARESTLADLDRALGRDASHVVLTVGSGAETEALLEALEQRLSHTLKVVRVRAADATAGEVCAQIIARLGEPVGADPEADLRGVVSRLAQSESGLVAVLPGADSIDPDTLHRLGELCGALHPGLRLALLVDAAQRDSLPGIVGALGVGAQRIAGPETATVPVSTPVLSEGATRPTRRVDPTAPTPEARDVGKRWRLFAVAIAAVSCTLALQRFAALPPGPVVAAPTAPIAETARETVAAPIAETVAGPIAETGNGPVAGPASRPPVVESVVFNPPRAEALSLVHAKTLPPRLPETWAERPASAAPIQAEPVAAPAPAPVEAEPPAAPAPAPIQAEPLAVSVNAHPWARIEVDARSVGVTPLGALRLAPGSHHFRAHLPDGRIVDRKVEVADSDLHLVFP